MSSTHYRVLNSSRKMDEDAETAFFHKNLGGYHGAKIKKYQELISFKLGIEHFQLKQAFLRGGRAMAMQLLPAMNMTNMLNAKYIIGAERGENGMQTTYIENPYRLGNAWFVDSVEVVKNAAALWKTADIVAKVRPPSDAEAKKLRQGQTLISFFVSLKLNFLVKSYLNLRY